MYAYACWCEGVGERASERVDGKHVCGGQHAGHGADTTLARHPEASGARIPPHRPQARETGRATPAPTEQGPGPG